MLKFRLQSLYKSNSNYYIAINTTLVIESQFRIKVNTAMISCFAYLKNRC